MQFNQLNQNTGDVNNAITEKGNVVQTVGDQNKVAVDQPKTGFWAMLWKKLKGAWKWLVG